MKARRLKDGIYWVGAIDWDRRVFDSLIPLPDGTSYNAYLVQGSDKVALIDTVEPQFADVLFARLESLGVERLDYVVINHAEQDHSGSLPLVLERFPDAEVLCTAKCQAMLPDLMDLPAERVRAVADGEVVELGELDLSFIHFPWVHWPETMLTYVPQARTLFSCDLFGSHLATNALVSSDPMEVKLAARLYYAQIMMPFRKMIARNLPRVEALRLELICPSHGPVHPWPDGILKPYREWVGDSVRNHVVLPYISMHESTRMMVDHLIDALTDRDVRVSRFDLESADLGKLAAALVDAATVVLATPTVLGGPHPHAMHAAYLTNLLRPKVQFASVIGSFGWGGRSVEQIAAALGTLKPQFLDPVLSKGRPSADVRAQLDELADTIAKNHAEIQALP
jgi:flavorubredoxin